MLITDRWSGLCWDYYMSNPGGDTIIAALTHFFGMLDRQYDIQPKVMEVDNELTTQKPKVKAFLEKECIKLEP